MELTDLGRQLITTQLRPELSRSWPARTRQCSRAVPVRRSYRRRVHRDLFRRRCERLTGWRLKLHDVSISHSQRFGNVHAQLTSTPRPTRSTGAHMARAKHQICSSTTRPASIDSIAAALAVHVRGGLHTRKRCRERQLVELARRRRCPASAARAHTCVSAVVGRVCCPTARPLQSRRHARGS